MSARLNVLRLRRGRIVGAGLIAVMLFLVFGFVFITDEPLVIQVTDEVDLMICPPYCDEAFLEIPLPEFDVPIEITFRPIITTTDSNGVEDVIRGELTFLQAISGLEIIQVGVPDKTFDNGNLKIELEFDTGNIFPMEIFLVKPSLDTVTIESGGTFLSQFTIPPKEKQKRFAEGGDVITVIGLETVTPDCTLQLPCIIGTSTGGIFTISIFDSPIGAIPQGETITTNFILTKLEVNISEDIDVGIGLPDPIIFPLPEPFDPPLQTQDDPFVELLSVLQGDSPQPRIEPVNFELAEPVQIYSVTFANVQFISEPFIVEQTVNATEVVIEEVIVEDIPNTPCFETKFDSISYLFPTVEISGTDDFWGTTAEGLDQNSVDVRNNRNCDLGIALGSKWVSATGEIFISDLEDITILTNATIPFKSVVFDSNDGCGGFACAGLKVTSCFIGHVSTTDPIEVIDDFCGNKFFR